MSYEDDKIEAVRALAKIDPSQPFGTELFNAIARLSISIAVEAIAMRWKMESGKIEVRLMQRPQDAPAYAGMWHCPGTFMRPGESEEDVLRRLEEAEFKSPVKLIGRFGWDNNLHEERGHVLHLLLLVKVDDLSPKWFRTDRLPEPMVEHHRQALIPAGAKAFLLMS